MKADSVPDFLLKKLNLKEKAMIQKMSTFIVFIIFSAILIMACASEMAVQKPAEPQKVVSAEPEKHADVDFSISCMECHLTETPEAVADWKESTHGKMNFGCYMCHGDGVEDFAPSPKMDRCEACHSGDEKCMMQTNDGKCFDCHDGHSMKTAKN